MPIIHTYCGAIFYVNDNGCCYALGQNHKSQLGVGDTTDKKIFTPIKGLPEGERVKKSLLIFIER